MSFVQKSLGFLLIIAIITLTSNMAFADGLAEPWQLMLQPAASPSAHKLADFHNILLYVISFIVLFVFSLLAFIIFRFNEKANPKPSKTSHNTLIEVIWTVVPIMILVFLGVPSMRLLYFTDKTHDAEITLKAVGHQWYWSYEYPDFGNFTFDSTMVPDAEIKPGQHRLLETDNAVVLPVNTNVRLLTTSVDVIHSFAVPALGLKKDAVPGRTLETWVRIEKEGTYYGQCSELCGVNHGFMPIQIKAVSKEEFEKWIAMAKKKFAFETSASFQLASR